jgi:CRISPR-associated endonuclease/helicase Cas3
MVQRAFFEQAFEALTGNPALFWQRRLFDAYFAPFDPPKNRLPDALNIPTGLGKTSVIVIWLIALALQAGAVGAQAGHATLPRRLVYIVNRRTVVDQATDIAETLRTRLRAALGNGGGPRSDAGVGAGTDHDDVLARWDAGKRAAARRIAAGLNNLAIDPEDNASPLAISTLRGEFADNGEWCADPARAAIIVGTVDMIGSRLLLSGYGVSRKMRPFHAGLIGQDALLIHDEAHLTPAFGELLRRIAQRQKERNEPRPLQVMELSATPLSTEDGDAVFSLDDVDRAEDEVKRRLEAPKALRVEHAAETLQAALDDMADCAFGYAAAQKRVLVYVRSPDHASGIAQRLRGKLGTDRAKCVGLLTGTIRGYERDRLAQTELFKGFRPRVGRTPPGQTEYLVATSAGEVGIDLDADHLVCDLTTLDSMIQRFGRVNRLGRGDAAVHVFRLPKDNKDATSDAESRLADTMTALKSLPEREGGHDASPQALRALIERLKGKRIDERRTELTNCFSKAPRIVPLTDILIDAWSLTRVDDMPGRPAVEQWLHGVTADPPSLYVAWREEVDAVTTADDSKAVLKALFDQHPVLARERLRGNRDEVVNELKIVARRLGEKPVIVLPAGGDAKAATLAELLKKDNLSQLNDATIVLPADAGGLDGQGVLDGAATGKGSLDVADQRAPMAEERSGPVAQPERMRVLVERKGETGEWTARVLGGGEAFPLDTIGGGDHLRAAVRAMRQNPAVAGMVEKRRIVLSIDDDEWDTKALVLLARPGSMDAAEAAQEGEKPVELDQHNSAVRETAECIVKKLMLLPAQQTLGDAVIHAAGRHDDGKNRPGWQKAIGHPPPREANNDWKPWAKSGKHGFDDSVCGKYRHEFGSLRQAEASLARDAPERDLILHLIAAHHGWARPHFRVEHWDIEGADDDENAETAANAMRRFARLQRRFGPWGLAWLESLVRAADYKASKDAASAARAAGES